MAQNHNNKIDLSSTKKNGWLAGFGIGIVVIVGLIYIPPISRLLGPTLVLTIYDLIVIATSVSASYLAIGLWRIYERGEMLSLIWGNIAMGLIKNMGIISY